MNSFVGWVGAKTKLAKEIASQFPKHDGYCEVFGGGGSVLFHKSPSPAEIYNDINKELVNLFRVVRDNGGELNDLINWTLSSREEFKEFLSMSQSEINRLRPEHRALRYYYIVRNSFGSNPAAGSFSSCQTVPIRWDARVDLSKFRDRLAKVTIENMSFDSLIKKYDHERMMFYLDPPYYVAEGRSYYEFDFKTEDHINLHNSLKDIKGKMALSYDDVPEVRELYKDFFVTNTSNITYTLSGGDNSSKSELLIFNYNPKDAESQMRLF